MNQPLTPEQYEAKIAAMQAALAKIPHDQLCGSLFCARCKSQLHPDAPGQCSNGFCDGPAIQQRCNCYLSTLSDDIERGKELLGAVQASRYNADVATQAVEEMKRQAVEIEELRKDKARLDWREANPCHGFGKYSDGTWADGKGGSHRTYRDAVSAAMKEKP